MVALICLIIGCAVGWLRAARRGGTTADKALYAGGHGVGFGLLAMFMGILLHASGLLSGV